MKILVVVLDKEIISATEFNGNTEITSDKSSIFIDTPENILNIMDVLGIEDVSKINFLIENS